MLYLYLLSIVSFIIQILFVTVAIAAGLYYLAELVEEYSVIAKTSIFWMIILPLYRSSIEQCVRDHKNKFYNLVKAGRIFKRRPIVLGTAAVHIGLIIFEEIPLWMNGLGLLAQVVHALLLKDFPVVRVLNPIFLLSVALLLANHYFAFQFFRSYYYSFSEVLAYFTLCLWVVPFALFVSLSANDNVLPTTGEKQPLLGDNNVVTDYFSRKRKKYGLLSFFSYAKDSVLPQRTKKAF